MVLEQYPLPSPDDDDLFGASAAPPMYTPSADEDASGETAAEQTAQGFMPMLT